LPQVARLVLRTVHADRCASFGFFAWHRSKARPEPIDNESDASGGLSYVIRNSRRATLLLRKIFWGIICGRQAQSLPVVLDDFKAHLLEAGRQVELRILQPMLLEQLGRLVQGDTDRTGPGRAVERELGLRLIPHPSPIGRLSLT